MLAFALLGLGVSALMLLAGIAWVVLRGEAQVETRRQEGLQATTEEGVEAEDGAVSLSRGVSVFKGRSAGASLYAEKSTREVLSLLRQGRWQEGLPWAGAMAGLLGVMFFLPLAILTAAKVQGPWPWLVSTGFLLAAVRAAWPRE